MTTSFDTKVLNSNFLSPSRFVFVIDTPELTSVSYHCQTINMPTVSANALEASFRQRTVGLTASSIEFEPFQARFIIDENLENYYQIYRWILSSVETNSQATSKKDVTLLIYNNNNIPSIKIQYVGAFPTSLSPVEFNTTLTGTQYLYADVQFRVDYFFILDR